MTEARGGQTSTWPEEGKRFQSCFESVFQQWNAWTYSYMNEILSKGSRQMKEDGTPLTQEDLFSVPKRMKSQNLADSYFRYYQSTPANVRPHLRLLRTMWKLGSPTYVPAGLCQLVVVICNIAFPLAARQLLSVLENNPNQPILGQGLPYAIVIFILTVVNALANHRHRHLALKTGVVLRATIVNIIYQHLLMLSPSSKHSLTSGQIINLVAVETQKIYEVTQEGHLIWALPTSVVLISYFLFQTLGPSTLVGIFILIAFVPLMERVAIWVQTIRKRRIKLSDERVGLVSDMLQGIRVIKFNCYEQRYMERITDVRLRELRCLGQEMTLWALSHVMSSVCPLLASAATFITYVLIDPSNILTASDIFGVLLLFTALKFPIKFFGRLIGKAGQALSAIRRISEFLCLPLRKKDAKGNLIDDTEKVFIVTEEFNLVESDDELEITESEAPTDESLFFLKHFEEKKDHQSQNLVRLANASYQAGDFTVSGVNLSISKGEVLAICGPVGSGKSTLLHGILEEAQLLGGKTRIYNRRSLKPNSTISYVSQIPFLRHESLRDNILFGAAMDWQRYHKVLDACCLRPDLENLENGDLTIIGGRGVNLSGGQKQRISLARAAYTQSPLVILDDPFSALDVDTGKQIFNQLIASQDALLGGSAIILVTHAAHLITHPAVKEIFLMVDGKNHFRGSWDELIAFQPSNPKVLRAIEHIQLSTREAKCTRDKLEMGSYSSHSNFNFSDIEESCDDSSSQMPIDDDNTSSSLERSENLEKENGHPQLKTWMVWFRHAGGIPFFTIQLFFMAMERFVYVGVEWFLAKWSSAVSSPVIMLGKEFPPQNDGRWAQSQYLKVYPALLLICVSVTFCRCQWAVAGGHRASRNVFFAMLSSVLRAPMSYFEKVPMGSILNRFTYDTDVNDILLNQNISRFMNGSSWYVAGVAIQLLILPWTAIAIIPVSLMYLMVLNYYRLSGPDLQRLDTTSRSPLQNMISECLEGSTTIRVFSKAKSFVHNFYSAVDKSSAALLNFGTAQRWLGIRIEAMGSLVVLVSSVFVVILNDTNRLEPGMVGLLILWSYDFTLSLNFLMDTYADTEATIISIERVDAMSHLPSERTIATGFNKNPLPSSWPEKGLLEFKNVYMRYREDLPLALNGLSFRLSEGKRCGIVGRTGAGKSSITAALFRLTEIESGSIHLDGVDLSTLGLSDVRGRGMDIIPQDPYLIGATLRDCLDPFGRHSDEAIWEALRSVRMDEDADGAITLSMKLAEGGSNFSVGQRQLLNLSRALLSQPKVLVLDEATASIDEEMDSFIQSILRTHFSNTTLITIAHRLNTIMDYDFVLVIDAGRVVESGSPYELLQIQNGAFSELVDSTGPMKSAMLREMAFKANVFDEGRCEENIDMMENQIENHE